MFDVELLAKVARTRQARATGKHVTSDKNRKARAYPLAGIARCAHCETLALEQQDVSLRSSCAGHNGINYRHWDSGRCTAPRKTVQKDVLEAEFYRLVKLLYVKPERIDEVTNLAANVRAVFAQKKDLE